MQTQTMKTSRPRGAAPQRDPKARSDRSRAVQARDAALARIVHTRRWIMVASVALSGALAGLASALLPGKSFGSSKGTSAAATSAEAGNSSAQRSTKSHTGSASSFKPALPAPARPGQLGLAGPGQAPQSSPTPSPPVQSSPAPSPAPAPARPESGCLRRLLSGWPSAVRNARRTASASLRWVARLWWRCPIRPALSGPPEPWSMWWRSSTAPARGSARIPS